MEQWELDSAVEVCGEMTWEKVELDPEGVPTVTVNDDDVKDFPKFMADVIREKVGMAKGCFKVSGLLSQTTLKDLCDYAKEYFSKLSRPETLEDMEENKSAYPVQQLFFYGSHSEHLYGIQQQTCTPLQFSHFVRKASEEGTYKTSPCCENALNESVSALEDHYWDVIGRIADKSESLGKSFTKATVNALVEKAAEVRNSLYPHLENFESNMNNVESLPLSLRRTQKKRNPSSGSILYCPGIPLEKKEFPITPSFSLSKLGTLLDYHPEKYPGLAYPYLYISSEHASFAWHVEAKALFSINLLHFGAPCVWFFVAPRDFKKFSEVAKLFPLDPGHVSCGFVLIHKYLIVCKALLAKHGIPVHVVIQRENEIVITYPYASHAGFKMGWNFSQAANFADPWWVEPALFVPPCACWPSQINMDIKEMVSIVRPDLLVMYMKRDYINLALAVANNEFLHILDILPCINISKELKQCAPMDPSAEEVEMQEEHTNEEQSKAVSFGRFKVGRYVLQCPKEGCHKTLEGGRTHLPRMLAHIEKKHPNETELVSLLHEMNPPRTLKSPYLVCPVCGEKRAGNKFHLMQHMKKKHPTP